MEKSIIELQSELIEVLTKQIESMEIQVASLIKINELNEMLIKNLEAQIGLYKLQEPSLSKRIN